MTQLQERQHYRQYRFILFYFILFILFVSDIVSVFFCVVQASLEYCSPTVSATITVSALTLQTWASKPGYSINQSINLPFWNLIVEFTDGGW